MRRHVVRVVPDSRVQARGSHEHHEEAARDPNEPARPERFEPVPEARDQGHDGNREHGEVGQDGVSR